MRNHANSSLTVKILPQILLMSDRANDWKDKVQRHLCFLFESATVYNYCPIVCQLISQTLGVEVLDNRMDCIPSKNLLPTLLVHYWGPNLSHICILKISSQNISSEISHLLIIRSSLVHHPLIILSSSSNHPLIILSSWAQLSISAQLISVAQFSSSAQ